MDGILDAARGAKSEEERAKFYKEFQERPMQTHGVVVYGLWPVTVQSSQQ
jgi:hypothetical protein